MILFNKLLKEAGYAGHSKSNNAISAEDSGELNATQLSKLLSCSSAAIKALLTPSSWHHTSKEYNKTNYYSEPLLLALAGKGEFVDYQGDKTAKYKDLESDILDDKDIEDGKTLLQNLKSYSKQEHETVYNNQHVEWLHWYGKGERPDKKEENNCTVTIKGSTAYVQLTDGSVMKKLVTTNGFSFTPQEAYESRVTANKNAQEQKEKERINWYQSNGGTVFKIDNSLSLKDRTTYYVAIKDGTVIKAIQDRYNLNKEKAMKELMSVSDIVKCGTVDSNLLWSKE